MIDAFLSGLADTIGANAWLAPLFAFAAGVIVSFTPCSLSSVPLIIGYVGGTGEKGTKKAFLYSVTFASGSAVTFVALGLAAAATGRFMGRYSRVWYAALGILMVLMALQTWGVFHFIPSTYLVSKNTKRGFLGAFAAGILGGIFSSPCSTPVLVALLAIVAEGESAAWGTLLMLLYALGASTLVILAGSSLGFVQKIKGSGRYRVLSQALGIVMGFLILLVGLYMFWLAF